MKNLMAKIKKTSTHYSKGLNQRGKTIWLSVLEFTPVGKVNYKIKAIKAIKNGFAEWQSIWVSYEEITLKQIEDNQLTLEIFSEKELEENKLNPRYFNQRRFEISTKNEKQYVFAPDLDKANEIAQQYGIENYSITQIPRLTKKELNHYIISP